MTTRERLDASARREQLMAAAVSTLAERGFTATTAEEIARRAGVSKGLLWHYYADLDDLFVATAGRTINQLASAVAANIDLDGAASTVIRSAIHAAAALRLSHDAERRAMQEIVTNLRTPDGAMRFSLADLGDLYSSQEALFRRGQESGEFSPALDPRILAVTYQGAVDSMLGYLDAFPDADAEKHAETVADILLGGIVVRSVGHG